MLTAALIVRPARRRSWLKASSPDHRVGRRNSRPPGKTDFIMNLSLAWVDQVQAIPSRRRSPALSIRSGQHRRGKLRSPVAREYDSSPEHCRESDVPGTGAGAAPLLAILAQAAPLKPRLVAQVRPAACQQQAGPVR